MILAADTGGKQWEQYQAADTLTLTLVSKGVPTKLLKFFWLKIFYTGVQPWAANISANFRKIWNAPNGILEGLGETDS